MICVDCQRHANVSRAAQNDPGMGYTCGHFRCARYGQTPWRPPRQPKRQRGTLRYNSDEDDPLFEDVCRAYEDSITAME